MNNRRAAFKISLSVAIATLSLIGIQVFAQSKETLSQNNPSELTTSWTSPRTASGQPDLQGVWANNTATPFERPKELEGRTSLTDEEVKELEEVASTLFNGETDAAFGDAVFKAALAGASTNKEIRDLNRFDVATGNYNQFWLVEREFDNRTSVIVEPKNGRIPELTPEAKKRRTATLEYQKLHPADGPEDLPLGHRCLNFGVPKVGAGYNSYHQIFQTRNYVAILSEMAHDARIVPIDGRPHLDSNIRQWNGDARGYWDGETLVIETRNFSVKSQFRESHENLHLVERFTRITPDTLKYEFTVTDPTTWVQPWSGMIPLKRSEGAIYEFACHEGNKGLAGALSGYRAQEKKQ